MIQQCRTLELVDPNQPLKSKELGQCVYDILNSYDKLIQGDWLLTPNVSEQIGKEKNELKDLNSVFKCHIILLLVSLNLKPCISEGDTSCNC